MTISTRMLLELAGSRQIYDRGVHIFNTGQVKLVSTSNFWKNQIKVKACANDDNETTKNVTMEFASGGILSSRCSCMYQELQHRGRLCSHAVATALAYLDVQDNQRKESDEQAVSMIRAYGKIRTQDVIAEHTIRQDKYFEPVRLMPQLSYVEGRLAFGFRIGRTRYYKVQDIPGLVTSFKNGDKCLYGKSLEFYCIPEAFDQESRDLILALSAIVEHLPEHDAVKPHRSSLSKDQSLLFPEAEDLDLLFEAIQDDMLETDGILSREGYLRFQNMDPKLRVFMTARTEGKPERGMNLVLTDRVYCLAGLKRDYIIYRDMLCRTSEEYHKYMGPFVEALSADPGEQEMRIRITGADMPAFCSNVLPFLREYASLDCDETLLEAYSLDSLRAEFLFDMPKEMEITLSIRLHYGDKCYNPVEETTVDYTGRDQAKEKEIALLSSQFFHHRYLNQSLLTTHEDKDSAILLLTGGLFEFERFGEILLSERLKNMKLHRPEKLFLDVNPNGDWLDLKIDMDGMEADELLEVLEHYQEKQKYYRLKNGDMVLLRKEHTEMLSELMEGLGISGKELAKGHSRLDRNRAFFLRRMSDLFEDYSSVNDWLVKMTDSLLDKEALKKTEEVPKGLKGVLRGYQEEGYQWLCMLDRLGFGGILADDMGLGKTIQMIALMKHLYCQEAKADKPALIVCPSSLIYNWNKEIGRFAPDLSVSLIIGSGKERKELLRRGPEGLVWITSYDLLRRDIEEYEAYEFRLMVLDEAQYIKNQGTQNARSVKKIKAVRRFALTGTPLENRLGELWSIFDYLMPDYLNSYHRFRLSYELPIVKSHDERSLKRLLMLIDPFILRRMKKEVLPELPEKCEITINPVLEGEQKRLYNAQALKLKKQLSSQSNESFEKNKVTILADLMRLREICCAPSLVYEQFKGENAKLDALMELVNTCILGGHRILIFSQFARMIVMMEEMLTREGIPCITLTGQTSKVDRNALVERFANEDIPVFLISLKAGGTGLNLTQADTVIHFDPWWNVAAQNQATDRAYRIGQTKEVNVYKLIAAGTIEENIMNLQNAKADLADQVLSGKNTGLSGLSREELMALL